MSGPGRRSSPPNIDIPEQLAEHVDASLLRVCTRTGEAIDHPVTARGALERLEVTRNMRGIIRDIEDRLLVWLVEDAQVSAVLVADALGIDPSNVGRSAVRAKARLRS